MPVYVIYAQDLLGVQYQDVITAQDDIHALECLDKAYTPEESTTKRGFFLLSKFDEDLTEANVWIERHLNQGDRDD